MKKASRRQITEEQEIKDLLHQPAGKEIIRQAGRLFAGAMFGVRPTLEHASIRDHGETLERETHKIKGGIPDYLLSRVRLGYRIEKALKSQKKAYFALGASASTYFMYGSPSALSGGDYAAACESLRESGYPEYEIDRMIDEIMKTILAHMETVPGRMAWGLMCGVGHNAYREHGHVFQATI